MTAERKAAITIGVLYVLGDLAGFASAALVPSFARGTNVLAAISAARTATILGALCILTMGFVLSAIPAVFYSIGRRFSETLTNGYLIFRGAFEGMICLADTLILLTLVALAAEPAGAAQAGALPTMYRVMFEQVGALPFAVGAFMFSLLLFNSRLVPRWLAVWGLTMAPLYAGAAFARMAGLDLDWLMFPLAIQEMVLAVWLIAKGFNPVALAQGAPQADETRAPSRSSQMFNPRRECESPLP
jgi:hypothetical protein